MPMGPAAPLGPKTRGERSTLHEWAGSGTSGAAEPGVRDPSFCVSLRGLGKEESTLGDTLWGFLRFLVSSTK